MRQSIVEKEYSERQLTALNLLDTFLKGYLEKMNERELFAKKESAKDSFSLIDILEHRLKTAGYQQLIKQRRETFAMNNRISSWNKQRGF